MLSDRFRVFRKLRWAKEGETTDNFVQSLEFASLMIETAPMQWTGNNRFIWQFRPDVILCGWQDVQIHELSN